MPKRENVRERALKWFAQYPWYEHHRCCDQQYKFDDDDWTAEDLEALRETLLDPDSDATTWDVPLYLEGQEVGAITLQLGPLFRAVSESTRYQRRAADDPNRRLTTQEHDAPLSRSELEQAVATVAGVLSEVWYESDLPSELLREVEFFAPTLNVGPAGMTKALNSLVVIDDLRSRRLLRALYAIGNANVLQKKYRTAPDGTWKREIEKEPQRLNPTGISTPAIVRKLRTLLDGADTPEAQYRACGRPRKVNRAEMRIKFQVARRQLVPLHARLSKLHSAAARRRLLHEFPDVCARLEHAGLLEQLVTRPCPPLEGMLSDLLAREMDISPHTARRYGRSRAVPKSRDHSFTCEGIGD